MFRKVPVVTTESSSFSNLPALALFQRVPFLRVPTDNTRLRGMHKRRRSAGREMSLRSRYRETRLIISTVSRRGRRLITRLSLFQQMNLLPALARSVIRSAGNSFHSSFCPENRRDATRGSRFLSFYEPQQTTNVISPSV